MATTKALIFQIPPRVCRNWHHVLPFRVFGLGREHWLPRFHRAGPLTSLDEKVSSGCIQLAAMIPQPGQNVKPAWAAAAILNIAVSVYYFFRLATPVWFMGFPLNGQIGRQRV